MVFEWYLFDSGECSILGSLLRGRAEYTLKRLVLKTETQREQIWVRFLVSLLIHSPSSKCCLELREREQKDPLRDSAG